MKRIFYRINEDLYFDVKGFMELVEGLGINIKDLKGVTFVRNGEKFSNTFNRLVHVN